MKVCKDCGQEIFTCDGVNRCSLCEGTAKLKAEWEDFSHRPAESDLEVARDIEAMNKRQRASVHEAMTDLGLTKVIGAMGGIYYE